MAGHVLTRISDFTSCAPSIVHPNTAVGIVFFILPLPSQFNRPGMASLMQV